MYSKYYTSVMKEEDLKRIKDLRTIKELCEFCAENYSGLTAIRGEGLEKTYKELLDDVASVRGFLKAQGYKKGDHIGMMLKNEYDFVKSFLGITTLGAVAVLIPLQTPTSNLSNVFARTDLAGLIFSRDIAEVIKDLNLSFKAFCQDDVKGKAADYENVTPDMKAAIIFTGGTIGIPKSVLLSQGNMMRGTVSGAFGTYGVWFQRYYALIPFTHVFGIIRNCLTVMYTGSQNYMCENMKNLITDLPKAKPTYLVLVPALADIIWGLMMKDKNLVGGSLTNIICGGAAVVPSLTKKLGDLGVLVSPGYGLTESSNLVSGNAHADKKPLSVGFPYDHQELKIVNNELWLKGENIMMGYYNNDAANKESFEDGWFKTGDLVKIDDDGELQIVGRIKNTIILENGENVSPEALENLINDIPLVKDTLVYEGTNAIGKPIIVAEVFADANVVAKMNVTDVFGVIQAEIDKINAKLPSYSNVHKLILRETDFERSASLKIIRKRSDKK